jgi:hypothetical protein
MGFAVDRDRIRAIQCALVSCLERHADLDGLSINIGIAPEVVRERARTTDG